MIPFDSHTHSTFSFDGADSALPKAMCESALRNGLTHLAITDHFEANNLPENLAMPYDADAAAKQIIAAKEEYKDTLTLSYGIEIGQAHQYPAIAERFLETHPFETVVGSVHNLRGLPDFYNWDMTKIGENEFCEHWICYLREILELISFGGFDILAHLTYPVRYWIKSGRVFAPHGDIPLIEKILGKVIDIGLLLEVNSSGWRIGLESPLPDRRILSLYREMGGSNLSIGSDAHRPDDIAADFDKTEEFLRSIGFEKVCFVKNKKTVEYRLDQ